MEKESVFPATVVYLVDRCRLVINRGSVHGLNPGQRFLVYRVTDDEIMDPTTGESLGQLEIVRGTGRVVHTQDRMATLKSDMRPSPVRRVTRSRSPFSLTATEEQEVTEGEVLPFEDAAVGDRARPI